LKTRYSDFGCHAHGKRGYGIRPVLVLFDLAFFLVESPVFVVPRFHFLLDLHNDDLGNSRKSW
jgi:hypothetical protein